MKTVTFEEEGEQTKDIEMYTKEEYLQLKDELHSSKVEADSLWEKKLELEKKVHNYPWYQHCKSHHQQMSWAYVTHSLR